MNADPFAPWYRWCEYLAFGGALERRRFAYLNRLAGAQRILVLGEGDGRALERLLRFASTSQIDVVESSGAMIAHARKRVGDSGRVQFRQSDALLETWTRDHYDGVVTLFFLDCFGEPDARTLIRRLSEALRPGGIWLLSDFAIPERGWRRWHAEFWIWTMYRFFAITTGLRTRSLPPMRGILRETGLRCAEFSEERFGLIRSEVFEKPHDRHERQGDTQ